MVHRIPLQKWLHHYSTLLQESGPECEGEIRDLVENNFEITEGNIKKALRKAKTEKGPGLGNIRMELLKYCRDVVVRYLKKLFNKIKA